MGKDWACQVSYPVHGQVLYSHLQAAASSMET